MDEAKPAIGKKHLAGISGGIGGVSGAVVLFVFTYFVTKDSHMEDVHRVEQKTDGNVPAWVYYPEIKDLKEDVMTLREKVSALEAKMVAGIWPVSSSNISVNAQ